jgi:hypothetical protein
VNQFRAWVGQPLAQPEARARSARGGVGECIERACRIPEIQSAWSAPATDQKLMIFWGTTLVDRAQSPRVKL